MRLGPLYHWSPTARRLAILAEGLVPYAQPVVHAGGEGDERFAFPYICLSPSAQLAWHFSGGSRDELEDEFDGWDLWHVDLPTRADVRILPFWGDRVQEVRVRSAIPASDVWYVATRAALSATVAS